MSGRSFEISKSIAFVATQDVRAAIGRIGRTEDVRFSPDGRRLVLAGLKTHRLLIIDIDAAPTAREPKIALTDFIEVESPGFDAPHGLAWADNEILIVANRDGCLCVLAIPQDLPRGRSIVIEPLRLIGSGGTDLVKTPGSLSVRPLGLGLLELLVCNNYVHYVTRHLVDCRDDFAVLASEILLDEGISVPDGVAQSPSGEWIAISNHDHRSVFLFRNDDQLDRTSEPHGILDFESYPHGLAFSADGRTLLVADAGAPFVHVFSSEDGDWSGRRSPSASIQALGDAEFQRGNVDPREGGPKGIDLTGDNRLLVATCESRPLAFFDMRGLLAVADWRSEPTEESGKADKMRDVLVRHLSAAARRGQQEADAIRRAGEFDRQALIARQLENRALLTSRSFRITAPLRSFSAGLQRLRRRH